MAVSLLGKAQTSIFYGPLKFDTFTFTGLSYRLYVQRGNDRLYWMPDSSIVIKGDTIALIKQMASDLEQNGEAFRQYKEASEKLFKTGQNKRVGSWKLNRKHK